MIEEWGFGIDAEARCRDLSVEQLQMVEIVRALARGARCVLLDEPTAALERDAVRRLFERVRQLVAGGVAVLYISHHLEEVFEICQDVAVLRDGKLVLTAPVTSLRREDLVAAMVGAAPVAAASDRPAGAGRGPGRRAGAGRRGPARGLPPRTAERRVAARRARRGCRGNRAAQRGRRHAGPGVVAGAEPTTRARSGSAARSCRAAAGTWPSMRGSATSPRTAAPRDFVAHLGVAENVTMTIADRLAGRLGLMPPGRRAAAAAPLTAALSLVSAGPGQPVRELSGGNQQKVTVSRTIAHDPAVVVAITPTRGVDVASKATAPASAG